MTLAWIIPKSEMLSIQIIHACMRAVILGRTLQIFTALASIKVFKALSVYEKCVFFLKKLLKLMIVMGWAEQTGILATSAKQVLRAFTLVAS